ncbi:MAG: DNA repair protein RadA [Acidobacteria bacterium]|nr:DNA repair protein RadA [Acidobacteriota bacterium]MCB9377655.1 DNA repair protein RadA [Holophagales bacterium]
MAAPRTVYTCQTCGAQSPKWLGRCPECGAWSSFVEETVEGRPRGGAKSASAGAAAWVPLGEVEEQGVTRAPSGLAALDRVLGGGIVAGGAVLLAGEPGIGKSTLLLQVADRLAAEGRRVVYASAEESPRQLRLRAARLEVSESGVLVAGETRLEAILAGIEAETPDVLLVDSIQALRSDELESPPGSIGQVRHAANRLVAAAKRTGFALFLVGHVTKEGAIAGPKSLEHLVDTVLAFEGEHESEHRILRATKNRFGPTGEIAMFEMRESGLEPVADPSGVLLARRRGGAPGSAVLPALSGSRPLLVEAQALVVPTAFPSPRRMSVGLDANRVVLLVAVLERFARVGLADRDVFLNVVGGLALREPAADLAVAAALVSAARGAVLPPRAVYFGEVGLLGEVRPVGQTEARLREAAAHGFDTAFLPKGSAAGPARSAPRRIEIATIDELAAAIAG